MDRIKEPSTWAGVSGVAQGAKLLLPPAWAWVADIVSLVAGAVAVKLREGRPA